MPHFHNNGTNSVMRSDGRDNTVIVAYDGGPIAAPVFVELPYRSTAAVVPSGSSLTRMGQAHNLDPSTTKVVAALIGPIGETGIGGEPVQLATTQTHPESSTYFAKGVRGELRDGRFTATSIVWTYDSRQGITGNPEGLVNGVYIMSSTGQDFDVAWGGAL